MIVLVILVFVDAYDAATPLPGALARAVEEALGTDVSVSIRTLDRDTPAGTLADVARAERALAVARIAWSDDRRLEARVEVTPADGSPSRSSWIRFDPSDPLAERGRTLGLVLAAIVAPEKRARIEEQQRATPPPQPVVAVVNAPAPPLPPRRFALDASAAGAFAVGGSGSGAGGAIGVRFHARQRLGLRVGVRAHFGEIAAAQAASLDLAAAAGATIFVRPPAEQRRLAVGLRAEALLVYQSLSHLSEDDPAPVRRGRMLPGALFLLEGQWALSPQLAVAVAAGSEIAFGTTEVFVRQERVARLAPARVAIEAGLVARF